MSRDEPLLHDALLFQFVVIGNVERDLPPLEQAINDLL